MILLRSASYGGHVPPTPRLRRPVSFARASAPEGELSDDASYAGSYGGQELRALRQRRPGASAENRPSTLGPTRPWRGGGRLI